MTPQEQNCDLIMRGDAECGIAPVGEEAEQQATEGGCAAQYLDEKQLVLERLLAAHSVWFNVTRNYEHSGRRFEGYAEFRSLGEKYILTKRAKLWEVEAHEYVFFAVVDELDEAVFADFFEFMKNEAIKKVKPGPNHMSSYVSLVLIADKISPEAAKALKKTNYHKTFKFGFQGWAEFRFCALDLSAQQVITNAMGKKMKASLGENAGFVASGTSAFFRRRFG